MTDQSDHELADKRLFRAIGDFLLAHRLHPGPDNYALVYQLISDETSEVAQAVNALIADGIRLSQTDADRIRGENRIDGGGALAEASEAISAARRQVADFASIVEATRAQAQTYGGDLARGADELGRVETAHPAVAGVARITGAMLERTRAAESQLAAARVEAQALRARLAVLQEEALSDPLTRLPNRRAFEDRLADQQNAGSLCSLAICDIDRFKRINDSHGHAVGDRVLRMVADVLRSNCEPHMVARIGGEEFVVLFDGMEAGAAAQLLDRTRLDLVSRQFKVRGTDAPLGEITFSAGVALCCDRHGEGPLKRADKLLYQAKNGGRNQVAVEAG